MTNKLYFVYQGIRHEISLDVRSAPNTIAQLLQHLPTDIDLHCAKIAGRHIFWHAPFIAELEQAQDVRVVPPGTFLYWPERQFLELIYGELQDESAQVTVLGHLTGDITWLVQLGEHLRCEHGHSIVWAQLEHALGQDNGVTKLTSDIVTSPDTGLGDERLMYLREARLAVWAAQPQSVTELVARRGILLPYGPLAMAEGEFRKLQELLWRYSTQRASMFTLTEKAQAAAFLLEAFQTRIVDLCGMHQCKDVFELAAQLLRSRPELYTETVQELILYSGRMAAWLDLYIPWEKINKIVVDANSISAQH